MHEQCTSAIIRHHVQEVFKMQDSDQSPNSPVPRSAPKQRSLLYIEDNPANVALVAQLIARRGELKFLTAIDGDLGLLLAQTCRPAIILMDICLPGKSGYDVLKLLQEDAATKFIPVVALSSNAYPHDIAKGIAAGFFRYLTKPYKIDELMDALNAALDFASSRHFVE
jgi:CheY-like chemotaxis protein